MYVVEIIPFKDFKHQIQLMKIIEKTQKNNIEILSNCIVIQKQTYSRGNKQ